MEFWFLLFSLQVICLGSVACISVQLPIIHILTALKVSEALKMIKLSENSEKLKKNRAHCTFLTLNKYLNS